MNRRKWEMFMHNNYNAEFTQSVRISVVPRLHPSELVSIFNIFNNKCWDRMFYNEQGYLDYTMKDYENTKNPFSKFDLDSEAGRKEFEAHVNRFLKLYPGCLVPEGEEYDFQAYYIKDAIERNRDLSKFDQKKVEQVRQLQLEFSQQEENDSKVLKETVDPLQAQIKIGSVMPKWVKGTSQTNALM